ncbi:MAG: serine hydroxymethyltransferase [Bacilli bacterium]|nr:serine hydroxymethyltransferase [Bacilli bacterium]
MRDKVVSEYFKREEIRQNAGIELIASENYPSIDVREAQGSIFTAKYAEGYPGRRYYGGCVNIDAVELLAEERAERLFRAAYANVQPHSGSQANFAAYHALLKPGDKVLSLILNDGGHLTHGSPVSFSSHDYCFCFYPLGEDGRLDYEKIRERLDEENPNLFLAGYSAYPYAIDFKKMRELIDEHNSHSDIHCDFMVDMAHIAGIVAAGLCQNPCDYADIVTTTTHKTLRGPRGGMILTNREDLIKSIKSAVFPYSQGGPLEHVIAAKAICFAEALHPEFKGYVHRLMANTKVCNDELKRLGCAVSGTENHLFLMNVVESFGLNGKEAQAKLEEVGITTNKNMIHGDKLTPNLTSGLRIGFAAATTRGCTEEDARKIANLIYRVLKDGDPDLESYREEVRSITEKWQDVMGLSFAIAE